ncbi:WAP-type 'four-disulfide core [Trichuris suis]|nr:WAP-type 'four-disulfide core [Trichuris suis]
MSRSTGRALLLFTCALCAITCLHVKCVPLCAHDEIPCGAKQKFSAIRKSEVNVKANRSWARDGTLSVSISQSLHDRAEEITSNLTFVKGRQSAKEVCPDGTNPLKYCCRSHCPFGYYCFYGVCCKHLKPGTCPSSFASTGVPAGPPCDNDLECPWKLKCCEVNNNTRCVFPDKYIGGTVTRGNTN